MVATGSVKMEQKLANGNMIQTQQILESGGMIKELHKVTGHLMTVMTPRDILCLLLEIMMVKSTTGKVNM